MVSFEKITVLVAAGVLAALGRPRVDALACGATNGGKFSGRERPGKVSEDVVVLMPGITLLPCGFSQPTSVSSFIAVFARPAGNFKGGMIGGTVQ